MNYSEGTRGGAEPGSEERVTATVKWYNRSKGFGFLTAVDGSGDVFLPAAMLTRLGHDEVDEGATLVCDVVVGPKGRAVAGIIEIDATTATPRPMRRPGGFGERGVRPERSPAGPTQAMSGIVKWFDAVRGFGFVSPEDGGRDIFVNASALRRSGIEMLTTGQPVRMDVQEAPRGLEAVTLTVE
jgi:CspA family cold shock protein